MQQILYVQYTNKHQQKWKVIWQKERFHWSIRLSGFLAEIFTGILIKNVKSKYIFWRIKLSNDFTNKSIWFCIITGRYWWSNGSIYRNRSFQARRILMTNSKYLSPTFHFVYDRAECQERLKGASILTLMEFMEYCVQTFVAKTTKLAPNCGSFNKVPLVSFKKKFWVYFWIWKKSIKNIVQLKKGKKDEKMADELYEARKVIEEYRKMLDQYS